MTSISRLTRSCALALCLPASAALADLTAAEAWADWEELMTGSGYTITADPSLTNDSVTVSNMSLALDMSDGADQGSVTWDVGTLRFVENGDGTVSIEVPDTLEFNFSFAPEFDDPVSGTLLAVLTDHSLVASGAPREVTYTFAAAGADFSLTNLMVDGEAMGEDVIKVTMSLQDTSYVTNYTVADLRSFNQTGTVAAVTYAVSFADPAGADSFEMSGSIRSLAVDANGKLPLELDTDDANALLNAGMEASGQMTTQGGNYDLTFKSPDGSGTVNSTSEGAAFDMRLDPNGIAYGLSQTGVNVNMLLTEFPLPVSFSASEMGMNLVAPLQKSAEAQDFSSVLRLRDVTVSDSIWGVFDPAGQLPRSPANVLVDLSGTAKVMFDVLDPAQADILATTEAAPGELQTLNLNALELDAVGARLTGQGGFRFDNSDLVTFDGFPRPEGAIDLTLTGANQLIDTLINMGLLPQEQAMGARMMMGLFAVPGDGPDTLNSRIEVTPEGHVVANGQRLR